MGGWILRGRGAILQSCWIRKLKAEIMPMLNPDLDVSSLNVRNAEKSMFQRGQKRKPFALTSKLGKATTFLGEYCLGYNLPR
ncbi:hypothetical protein TRIUR3_01071 [Triticum urartu]|uniref:Uncharacterized protein n=1 Tax=Triticum urartu TaxID=4572 RepID=M7YNH1_TRIUA|nr:hypothetical protein TRIUR3_01071 [Triticum urartu]